MAYKQREGDIALYTVKEKKNPKGPDITGKALINGKEMQISLWIKSETMWTGQIKEKYQSDYSEAKKVVEKGDPGFIPGLDDSEIPWD